MATMESDRATTTFSAVLKADNITVKPTYDSCESHQSLNVSNVSIWHLEMGHDIHFRICVTYYKIEDDEENWILARIR